jgi:hypothetical protein
MPALRETAAPAVRATPLTSEMKSAAGLHATIERPGVPLYILLVQRMDVGQAFRNGNKGKADWSLCPDPVSSADRRTIIGA